MSTEHSNTPITHEELTRKMNSAVQEGNTDEIDRLMAVEIAEPEVEEEVIQEVVEEAKEETPEPDVTQDETSTEGEVETKDEAATDSAASKPEDKTELNELDQLKQELHRLKSDAGRVPYMQRRQQELERELRDLKLSHKPATKANAETETAVSTSELPAALKQRIERLREIDPDLADTLEVGFRTNIEAAEKAKATAAETVKEYANSQDAKDDEAFIQQQYTQLVTEVPYAPQVFQSKEWKQWKETLSPGRRALAESAYADEVKIAIAAFAQDMQTRFGGAEKTQPAAQPDTPVVSEAVTKVQESRERKLNAGVDTKAGAAKGSKPQLNEQELFSAYFNQVRKDNNFG